MCLCSLASQKFQTTTKKIKEVWLKAVQSVPQKERVFCFIQVGFKVLPRYPTSYLIPPVNFKLDMTTHGVQLATKEEETCRGWVNKLSQAPHVLGLIREKFDEAQLGAFRTSFFGHLQGVDELAFSGQLIHDLSLRRVANQGLKT
ncbi:hypothetical protein C1H46_000023 [Malus baccata]|uniref:Uncharacterized protein n=1 Tax=Malus baccata TaxID=106549 RepID=A0A540NSU2_MALBA|nr:hypothetical protein C1H46_000023 [Malus baccata]